MLLNVAKCGTGTERSVSSSLVTVVNAQAEHP